MLVRLLSVLGSVASLLSLVFVFHPTGQTYTVGEGVLLGIGIVLSIVAVISEFWSYFHTGPRFYTTKRKIRDYMYRWILHGGKVCIFSNNLSWVDDEEMKSMLRDKARRGDLTLCLPDKIPLCEELEKEGGKILTYPRLKLVPQSRFTIINEGRMDSQVAVGRRIKEKHCIEKFAVGEHPVFALAMDLVEVIASYNDSRRNKV